jgi:hypothetical protein
VIFCFQASWQPSISNTQHEAAALIITAFAFTFIMRIYSAQSQSTVHERKLTSIAMLRKPTINRAFCGCVYRVRVRIFILILKQKQEIQDGVYTRGSVCEVGYSRCSHGDGRGVVCLAASTSSFQDPGCR